jgi:hypothetical protein
VGNRWSILLAGAVCLPAAVAAQFSPVGVPRGLLRLELDGALETVDRRYFDGTTQEFAADLASPALGADRIPGLADADAALARISGTPGASLDLGRLTATAHGSRDVGVIGLGFGLTSRLSIFARLPLARTTVSTTLTLDSTSSNAGINPADPVFGNEAGAAQTAQFISDFNGALQSLQGRIQAGVYDGDPTLRALAQNTLAAGTSLRNDLAGLLLDPATASAVVPTAGSQLGLAVAANIQVFQATLSGSLGVPGFTTAPALPVTRASQDALIAYLTDPRGPIAGRVDEAPLSQRGDAEVGGVFTLIDRWNDDAHGTGLRIALSGVYRLGTGFPERPSFFLDIGTGTGHSAVGGAATVDVGLGRFGARLTGGYLHQMAANDLLRVTPPDQPYAPFNQIKTVRVDPGDVLTLGAHPFVRLVPGFALQAGLDYRREEAETVTYLSASDSIPGLPASVLALDSEIGVTSFSAGVTYATPAVSKPGAKGIPVDAQWTIEQVVGGSGGRVRKFQSIRGGVRVYFRIF